MTTHDERGPRPSAPPTRRRSILALGLVVLGAGCSIDNPAWQGEGGRPATDSSASATTMSGTSDAATAASTSSGASTSASAGTSQASSSTGVTNTDSSATGTGGDATSSSGGATSDTTGGNACDGCTECESCVEGACVAKGADTPCGESIHCEDYAAKQENIGEVSACFGYEPKVVSGKCDGQGTCLDPLASCVLAATPFVSCGPACLGDGASCTQGAPKTGVLESMCYIDEPSPICQSFCSGLGFTEAHCGPAGTCKKAMVIPCGGYKCTPDGCKTKCVTDDDCVGGFFCMASACVPL